MPIERRILTLGVLGTAAMLLNGCVASESSVYRRQLNQSMANEPTADEDVAFAFGLDDYAPDRASVTALGGGRTDDVGPP